MHEHLSKEYSLSDETCIFDLQDFPNVNLCLSNDAVVNGGPQSFRDIDSASVTKMIEKATIFNNEIDYTLLLFTFSGFHNSKDFFDVMLVFWMHILDHGNVTFLDRVIDMVAMFPSFARDRYDEEYHRYLDNFIVSAENSLATKSTVNLSRSVTDLIQNLRWLRYECRPSADIEQENILFAKRSANSFKRRKLRRISSITKFIIDEPYSDTATHLICQPSHVIASHLSLLQENTYRDISWHAMRSYGRGVRLGEEYFSEDILDAVQRSNDLTDWALWTILSPPVGNGKKVGREVIIEKLFDVAVRLYHMRNLDSLLPILLALQHPAVSRLDTVWAKVSRRTRKQCAKYPSTGKNILLELSSPNKNWNVLRRMVAEKIIEPSQLFLDNPEKTRLPPPGIAFFGLICNDLILNEESKHDFIASYSTLHPEPMINVKKATFQCETIKNAYCIGVQGVDILGRRTRATYWDSLFTSKNLPLQPHLYLMLKDVKEDLDRTKAAARETPDGSIGNALDIYALSRLIEP